VLLLSDTHAYIYVHYICFTSICDLLTDSLIDTCRCEMLIFITFPHAFRNVFVWKSSRDSQNNNSTSSENSCTAAPGWTLFRRLGSKPSEQDITVNVVCFITICSVFVCLVGLKVYISCNEVSANDGNIPFIDISYKDICFWRDTCSVSFTACMEACLCNLFSWLVLLRF
jgi:hypothetical protein